jgi:hypothetical protein
MEKPTTCQKFVLISIIDVTNRSSILRPYNSAGSVYVNLLDITSKFRVVATFVTYGLQKIFRIQSAGTFVIYQLTKFNFPRSGVPLITVP